MAVRLLQRLRLYEAVFEVHPSATSDVTDEFAAAGSALAAGAYDIITTWPLTDLALEDRRLALLSALLLPLRETKFTNAKGKSQSMSYHIVRDSLKWRAKDSEIVDSLHSVAPRLLEVYAQLQNGVATEEVKVALGRCIRELKTFWRIGMYSYFNKKNSSNISIITLKIQLLQDAR